MIRIGKIVATHGLAGSVIMTHIVGNSNWLKKEDVLFLELHKESYIPFFISGAKAANDEEYIVNLEDIGTVEAARRLIGKHVYVQEAMLADQAKDSPLLWIGFNVVDKARGTVGIIEDVMQTGAQWLGKFTYEGKEVLVPLVSQIVLDVNARNKYIRVDLPQGLLEL